MNLESGYLRTKVEVPPVAAEFVRARDWVALDRLMRIEANERGSIFREMEKYTRFSSIEFIISIRSSLVEPDEDGIWHDDGSRVLAFSLSLTENAQTVQGGVLEIRKRGYIKEGGEESALLSTPAYGEMLVFATGVGGFEHRVHRVTQGERIVIAGWCSV